MDTETPWKPVLLDKARGHLWLIKARLMHLADALDLLERQQITPHYLVALDQAYLDIRKVIEELMLLSVCAHDFASLEITNNLRKAWHAEKIVAILEKINPRFYPEPLEIHPSDEEGIAGVFKDATTDCLRKTEAIRFYNQCGDILHATNKDVDEATIRQRFLNATVFLSKVLNLLNCFEIHLAGRDANIYGQLLFDDRSRPPEIFFAPLRDGDS